MSRQETIERITQQLPHVPDEVLQSLLTLLEHVEPMDAWEKVIAEDSLTKKFDSFIEGVLSDHKAGKTTTLAEEFSNKSE